MMVCNLYFNYANLISLQDDEDADGEGVDEDEEGEDRDVSFPCR